MLLGAVVACGDRTSPPPNGAQVGPALAAALAAADRVRAPWRCGAPDGPGHPEETLQIGDRAWRLEGRTLRREGKPRGEVTIGVLADAGGPAPTTLASLGRLRDKLARADLVLTLGGMGTTQAELEATLGALAERAPFPVLAVPGDLEGMTAQGAAIRAMRTRGQIVLDGRLVQRVDLGPATLGVVGGAGARSRLVADDDGCRYRARDVAVLLAELTARPGVRALVTAEAPRGERDGEPTGELAVTATDDHPIDVALHGPTLEPASRARTGARDGDAVALTPGTIDATPRLPGPVRPPTAGLLLVRGGTWTWKPITDAE